ncbi:MAG: hypothetical protein BroJett022_15870 [Actinomycetes bacterium]|nr:MAG: hypothetical protein BroJett022_15870 [Actinomycetes bacterium]
MVLTIGLVFASEAVAGRGGGGRPDLVVSGAQVDGKEYAFRSESINLEIGIDTENRGRAKAGRSVTGAYLARDGDKYELRQFSVPRLKPREIDRPRSRPVSRSNDHPPGGYGILVCTDVTGEVRESNEDNNCARVKKTFDSFYSTYRDWTGVLSGSGWGLGGPYFPGMRETWTSTGAGVDVAYTFKRYGGAGRFIWTNRGGAVKYTHSGSLPPACTSVAGSGTLLLETGGDDLDANYESERYAARAIALSGATYPITGTCPGGGYYGGVGPVHPVALYTGRRGLPFGTKQLKGTVASQVDPGATYTWSLTGR